MYEFPEFLKPYGPKEDETLEEFLNRIQEPVKTVPNKKKEEDDTK